ncbi:MAG: dynamin family protein [Planctomycetota bacterium]
MKLLDQRHEQLLDEQRAILDRLVAVGKSSSDHDAEMRDVRHLLEHIDEFFLLVVVGEVKAGKSAFVNSLLGHKVSLEGPTPVTDRIHIFRFGETESDRTVAEFVQEKTYPIELLRHVHIVDTPGTNSIIQRHQEITEDFIPKADLILFVTSIDRPYSESEHQFLSFITERWHKKVVFILSKIDTRDAPEIDQVVDYVRANCLKFHGFDPQIFPVSPKLGFRGRQGDAAAWDASQMEAVERYIAHTLTAGDKARLKLEGTADATASVIGSLEAKLAEREKRLKADFEMVTDLDAQVVQTGRELKDRYYRYIAQIYDLLREFEQRGKAFFEERLRISKVALLRDPKRFREDFEREAVGNLKERIDDTMNVAVDWLIKEELSLYERSVDFLTKRVKLDKYDDRVASQGERSFDYNREVVFRAVRQAFQVHIGKFDIPGECHRILDAANRGILQQIGLQAGAVGLGTVLVMLLTATWADVTGGLFALGIFVTGFAVLPRIRRKAIAEFVRKVDALIREFKQAIVTEFDREIDARIASLRTCYDPYLVFYRSESGKIQADRQVLGEARNRLAALKNHLKSI